MNNNFLLFFNYIFLKYFSRFPVRIPEFLTPDSVCKYTKLEN